MLKMAAYDEAYGKLLLIVSLPAELFLSLDEGEDMEIAILDGSIEMDIDLTEEELLIGEVRMQLIQLLLFNYY